MIRKGGRRDKGVVALRISIEEGIWHREPGNGRVALQNAELDPSIQLEQEAQLSLRNRATRCQLKSGKMLHGLHLKRPATGE